MHNFVFEEIIIFRKCQKLQFWNFVKLMKNDFSLRNWKNDKLIKSKTRKWTRKVGTCPNSGVKRGRYSARPLFCPLFVVKIVRWKWKTRTRIAAETVCYIVNSGVNSREIFSSVVPVNLNFEFILYTVRCDAINNGKQKMSHFWKEKKRALWLI